MVTMSRPVWVFSPLIGRFLLGFSRMFTGSFMNRLDSRIVWNLASSLPNTRLRLLNKINLKWGVTSTKGQKLLVGTRQGHLLVYSVKNGGADARYEVTLERSNKSFSKKPIVQLAVVPEFHIVVSLSDGVVSAHELTVFAAITTLSKSRGASLFQIDVQKHTSQNGDVQPSLRLCVAVRRKLHLYYWKNREFLELQGDLSLPDQPRAMSWCRDSICVGFKRDYYLIKIEDGTQKELFPTGSKHQEPTVTKLDNDRLALGRDDMTIFIDYEGNPTQKYALSWSEMPLVMVHHAPYIIAVLSKAVEVRTIEPRLLIQTMAVISSPKLVCHNSDQVYVASTNYVWRLAPTPITHQIKQLLISKEFELALELANMTDDAEVDKQQRINYIRNLYAFDLFVQHRFEESLRIFAELRTDPSHVIGLFPNLLPGDYKKQLQYPEKTPELEGGQLEKGYLALIEYLIQRRNEILKDFNEELVTFPIVESNSVIKSRKALSQIIDTTLLKCYLNTNDAFLAPLLRLKDNSCHLEESERVLKKHQKHEELIILYNKRGHHRKALDLLLRQSQKPSSPLKGHDPTVQYLQKLGPDHIDLITEYADWVLKKFPEDGLKIFIEDVVEVELLPRDRILEYLERVAKSLVMQYLEHVIHVWNETGGLFHNVLALNYKDKICEQMEEYLHSLPEGQPPAKPGQEPGELGELKRKIVELLKSSKYYIPERLLAHFPVDSFFEERAILLGRLGRHEQALAIYVHVLKDFSMAEEYCCRHFEESDEHKDVFLVLLQMYLAPRNPTALGVISVYNNIERCMEPNLMAALKLLEEHAAKIDTAKALLVLPDNIHIKDVIVFLESVLQGFAQKKRDKQVLKSLYYSENLQVKETKIFYEKTKCVITDEKVCKVCKKRIGTSAFVRYPNSVILHYGCCTDRTKLP